MKVDLDWCRERIDSLDAEIIKLLEQRYGVVEQVRDYKKANGLAVRDEARERLLVERAIGRSTLDRRFIADFYRLIFNYSYLIEE